jgi:HEAT repeat protein
VESGADFLRKCAAIKALGEIGDARAIPVLERVATTGARRLRVQAAQSLHEIRLREDYEHRYLQFPSNEDG